MDYSFKPKKSKKPLRLKHVAENASARYGVASDYQRFNQKYNMIFQPEWNETYLHMNDTKRMDSAIALAKKNIQGYRPYDWAFLVSSDTNMRNTHSGINVPNAGATKWTSDTRPISKLTNDFSDSSKNANILKSVSYFYGADFAGICKLDRNHVYSHYFDLKDKKDYQIVFSDEEGFETYNTPTILSDKTQVIPKDMKYVIVMLFEMSYDGIETAASLTSDASTRAIYSKMSLAVSSVAEYIRGLGFNAIPSLNDTASNIPLAIDAGLGELSRNAKLIHPTLGPRCRICKVITDLPLEIDQPISFGVENFCNKCTICAEKCPVQAISYGPRSYSPKGDYSQNSVKQWQIEHDTCRGFWTKSGTNCGICISVCPFNRVGFIKPWIFSSLVNMFPSVNDIIVRNERRKLKKIKRNTDSIWNGKPK